MSRPSWAPIRTVLESSVTSRGNLCNVLSNIFTLLGLSQALVCLSRFAFRVPKSHKESTVFQLI